MALQSASAWIAPLQTYTTGSPCGAGYRCLTGLVSPCPRELVG